MASFLGNHVCDRIPVLPKSLDSSVGVLGKNSGCGFSVTGFDDSFKGICYVLWSQFLGLSHHVNRIDKKCVSQAGQPISPIGTWYPSALKAGRFEVHANLTLVLIVQPVF